MLAWCNYCYHHQFKQLSLSKFAILQLAYELTLQPLALNHLHQTFFNFYIILPYLFVIYSFLSDFIFPVLQNVVKNEILTETLLIKVNVI